METLYPLKFIPVYKNKIWGGNRFRTKLRKLDAPETLCGESWEISGVEDNCSVVSNGFLKGNTLPELVTLFMDDLVGETVFAKQQTEFPLLFKFLDLIDLLSIQVHPGDEIAIQRHDSLGKTEMWYIVDAEPGSQLTIGFNKTIDKDTFIEYVVANKLPELLNQQTAQSDEVYFIPAGRIHSSGKGLLIAEIQQSSDVTYRIFDWNRVEPDGTPRELHVSQSLDVLDYKSQKEYKTKFTRKMNESIELESCEYFTVNLLEIDKTIIKDYSNIDSFIAYMCLDGDFVIKTENNEDVQVSKGESVLVPACIKDVKLQPSTTTIKILEVHV